MTEQDIELEVIAIREEAQGVKSFEFRHPHGGALAPFTAGSHLDLHLANGLPRSYSLCNRQDETDRYVVAVARDPNSRGGSTFMHDDVKIGDRIPISGPRNHFPLVEGAEHVVFIAGGIGITPMWCMIQRLESIGRSWELFYSCRVRELCAFQSQLEELERAKPGRVHFNFDQEPGGKMTDLKAVISAAPAAAHLYCCGPNPMLKAFEDAAHELGRPSDHVHVEYFAAKQEAAHEGGFSVVLAQSGLTLEIEPGTTILDTLLDNGIDVPYSCTEGVCGTCECKVLEGIPDHRDSVLTEEERAANDRMMVCCGGSKTPTLVLDL